mmetsp:Transcript_5607/g.14362  ORF Transcript_5607/g.14362 Transcript_5607/m.14362 type:complete len:301 (-) Transcript_5607:271-1173(-)
MSMRPAMGGAARTAPERASFLRARRSNSAAFSLADDRLFTLVRGGSTSRPARPPCGSPPPSSPAPVSLSGLVAHCGCAPRGGRLPAPPGEAVAAVRFALSSEASACPSCASGGGDADPEEPLVSAASEASGDPGSRGALTCRRSALSASALASSRRAAAALRPLMASSCLSASACSCSSSAAVCAAACSTAGEAAAGCSGRGGGGVAVMERKPKNDDAAAAGANGGAAGAAAASSDCRLDSPHHQLNLRDLTAFSGDCWLLHCAHRWPTCRYGEISGTRVRLSTGWLMGDSLYGIWDNGF